MNSLTQSYLKDLTYHVNGACIEVHKHLGPGLLESVYHQCLKYELTTRNLSFVSEHPVPVSYKGKSITTELRCDFFIENVLVLEIKSVDALLPIHDAQTLTYMKLLSLPKGILVNFNVENLYKYGQKTFVNERFRLLPV